MGPVVLDVRSRPPRRRQHVPGVQASDRPGAADTTARRRLLVDAMQLHFHASRMPPHQRDQHGRGFRAALHHRQRGAPVEVTALTRPALRPVRRPGVDATRRGIYWLAGEPRAWSVHVELCGSLQLGPTQARPHDDRRRRNAPRGDRLHDCDGGTRYTLRPRQGSLDDWTDGSALVGAAQVVSTSFRPAVRPAVTRAKDTGPSASGMGSGSRRSTPCARSRVSRMSCAESGRT